jgi:colicin import membrane protein
MNVQVTIAQADEVLAIALPVEDNLPAAFAKPNGIAKLVAQIEAAARSEAKDPDMTTKKGRDAIVSLAYKVTRSKTAIESTGKGLNADRLALNKAVNTLRTLADERLTALADEIRTPLTNWEYAEDVRTTAHKDAIQDIGMVGINDQCSVEVITRALADLEAIDVSADRLEEYAEFAAPAKEATADRLRAALIVAQAREDAASELAKLRAEAAAREIADRQREADQQAERDAVQAVSDKRAAEQQATIDKLTAAAQAAEDAAQAKVDEASAAAKKITDDAQKVEDDAAAQVKADADAAQARTDKAANEQAAAEQRVTIREAIAKSIWELGCIDAPESERIAAAIIDGKITHVGVIA